MAGNLTPGREVIASARRPERGQQVADNAAMPTPKTESPPPPTPGRLVQVAVSLREDQVEEIRRYVDARVREIAPLVAHRMKELEEALEEVLDSFGRGYRRYSAVRSGWVPEDQVDRWRAVLNRRAR